MCRHLFLVAALAVVDVALAFNQPTKTLFSTFGNAQARELAKSWQPRPLDNVIDGDVMLPSSTENMKRFVRARILLEDQSLGCVAAADESSFCLILTRFSKAEHQLLYPLWHPSVSSKQVFEELLTWHKERFGNDPNAPRLSGAHLESDKDVWTQVISD